MTPRNVSRREFIHTTGLTAGGTAFVLADDALGVQAPARQVAPPGAAPPAAAAVTLQVRPNVATLSPTGTQIRALRAGVAKMRSLNASQPESWRAQANIHNNFCPHGNWFFLPWHRAYLYYFELICREASGDSTFTLPYWDWTTSPRLPAPFWGANNPLNDTTRVVGPNTPTDPAFVGAPVINTILQIPDFLTFGSGVALTQRPTSPPFGATGRLEGTPHNYIHNFVGGNMGTFMSPLDPIFWLHHANIDRLWAEWTRRHPGRTPNDPRWLDFSLNQFFQLNGTPITRRVSEVLTTYQLGYRYDTQPAAAPAMILAAAPVAEAAAANLRSEAAVPQPATFEAPVTVSLSLPAPLRRRVGLFSAAQPAVPAPGASAPARPDPQQALRLALEGITPPQDPRVEIRVFINEEKPDANTPIDSPTYLGSVTFFNGAHAAPGHDAAAPAHDDNAKADDKKADDKAKVDDNKPQAGESHPKASFYFDLDEAVERLARAGLYQNNEQLRISLVPVPLNVGGPAPQAAKIDPNKISLSAVG